MTNGEKFRAVVDRTHQFKLFCESQKHGCNDCKLKDYSGDGCRYAWLELEYEERLKPCPFCGGEAERSHIYTKNQSYPIVRCKQCDAMTKLCKTGEEAIAVWNRRA